MEQLKRALEKTSLNKKYIKISFNDIKFTIEDGTRRGLQVSELLEFVRDVFLELDADFPCKENKETIDHIAMALDWQRARTKDRESRGVEGLNKI